MNGLFNSSLNLGSYGRERGVPVRVLFDIVFELSPLKRYRCFGLYTPQGAEKDYRNDIGPVTLCEMRYVCMYVHVYIYECNTVVWMVNMKMLNSIHMYIFLVVYLIIIRKRLEYSSMPRLVIHK